MRSKFEDTQIAPSTYGVELRIPIPNGPLRRYTGRIFDNQVEHASRENARRSGLIILTKLYPHRLSSAVRRLALPGPPSWVVSEPQDLNESLILAQNQRWRRA